MYSIDNNEKILFEYTYKRYLLKNHIFKKSFRNTESFPIFVLSELNVEIENNAFHYKNEPISFYSTINNSMSNIVELWEFRAGFTYKNVAHMYRVIEDEFKASFKEVKNTTKKYKKFKAYDSYLFLNGLRILATEYGAKTLNPIKLDGFNYSDSHNFLERTLEEKIQVYIDDALNNGDISDVLSESKLEQYLIKNIEILEDGLKVVSNQYDISNGRIDILALDKNNTYVILELKIKTDKDIIWQAHYYPEQLKIEKRLNQVRFIAVAPYFPPWIKSQLEKLKSIELIEFEHTMHKNEIKKFNVKKLPKNN